MTLSPLIPVTTILYAAGILSALAVVAYILKMRRRRFEVPFSMLWQRVLREKETTSLWRHLRRILSLLLQLLILALLLLAVLDPQLGKADDDAKNIVIVVDTSASMKAVDETVAGVSGKVTRMEAAKAKVLDLLSGMGGGDSVMLMRMDGQTTPLTRFESDIPRLTRVVHSLQASDTPADLRRALSAAGDALRDRKNKMLILVGDGAYRDDVLADVQLAAAAPVATAQPVLPADGEVVSDAAVM
ncbi:MAG TPA: VWA domain-containing protein, partial [Kofleriaceae bacterium]|nr:VWA domain-containing protein [Kofleriaceae bacterium]